MKHLILVILLVALTGHAAPQFLTKGIDLTGQSSVSPAQLNQLVDAATSAAWHGMVIATNNLPNLTAYPAYTNFVFIDQRTTPPAAKVYYGNGTSNTETNWVLAQLGGGSVTSAHLASPAVNAGQVYANAIVNSNIANNAVTDVKISAGAINNSHLQGGSVSNANLADRTITGDKIATLTLLDTNIAANTITGGKLVAGTIGTTQLADGSIQAADVAPGTSPSFLATTTGGAVVWTNFITAWLTNGIAMPTTTDTITNSHNLAAVPHLFYTFLRCETAELGYNSGDEVPCSFVVNSANDRPYFTISADANKWYVTTTAGTQDAQMRTRTNTFVFMVLTDANWRLGARLYKINLP